MATPSYRTLARVDLNLLCAFRALDESRSVTGAAKELGVSQPAMSHALKRLRASFDDPLFVPTPRGLTRTALAERLSPRVRDALDGIERDIYTPADFRPSLLVRTFRVRTTDYVEALLAGPLVRAFAQLAPRASLVLSSAGFALPKAELEDGACDLAIAGFFGKLPPGYYEQPLFTDTFGCAVRGGHPRVGKRAPSLEAFCKEAHVLIAPGGELRGVVDRELARAKLRRHVVVGTSGFTVAGFVAAQSDAVLTAPARLLGLLAQPLDLFVFAPPLPLPSLRIVQTWHARQHGDPAHQWLRRLVRDALGGTTERAASSKGRGPSTGKALE